MDHFHFLEEDNLPFFWRGGHISLNLWVVHFPFILGWYIFQDGSFSWLSSHFLYIVWIWGVFEKCTEPSISSC